MLTQSVMVFRIGGASTTLAAAAQPTADRVYRAISMAMGLAIGKNI